MVLRVTLYGCIQKFPDRVDKQIYAYNNKHSLRSNTRGYSGNTRWTDPQNSDTTALSGRELYHLQFSLQVASPETFGYTLVTRVSSASYGIKKCRVSLVASFLPFCLSLFMRLAEHIKGVGILEQSLFTVNPRENDVAEVNPRRHQ
jgi:hypothetical protein